MALREVKDPAAAPALEEAIKTSGLLEWLGFDTGRFAVFNNAIRSIRGS
ncbi:MAG: hypothetical protein RL417_1979 [Pseudomonadota bacterium]|jgi:hypothetical protein